MDDKTEELIALIAKKHGIALDETDPIMVVPTLLRYLLDESQEKFWMSLNPSYKAP